MTHQAPQPNTLDDDQCRPAISKTDLQGSPAFLGVMRRETAPVHQQQQQQGQPMQAELVQQQLACSADGDVDMMPEEPAAAAIKMQNFSTELDAGRAVPLSVLLGCVADPGTAAAAAETLLGQILQACGDRPALLP